jgi:hypothetical protein
MELLTDGSSARPFSLATFHHAWPVEKFEISDWESHLLLKWERKWSDIVMNSLTANRLYILLGGCLGLLLFLSVFCQFLFFTFLGAADLCRWFYTICYLVIDISIFRWPRDGDDDDKFRDDIFILPTNITIKWRDASKEIKEKKKGKKSN